MNRTPSGVETPKVRVTVTPVVGTALPGPPENELLQENLDFRALRPVERAPHTTHESPHAHSPHSSTERVFDFRSATDDPADRGAHGTRNSYVSHIIISSSLLKYRITSQVPWYISPQNIIRALWIHVVPVHGVHSQQPSVGPRRGGGAASRRTGGRLVRGAQARHSYGRYMEGKLRTKWSV